MYHFKFGQKIKSYLDVIDNISENEAQMTKNTFVKVGYLD